MSREQVTPELSITSYGGVEGQVTGSCHVFESRYGKKRNKLVIDCGIYQGKEDLSILWKYAKGSEDMVDEIWEGTESFALTHRHADHGNGIPTAFTHGYKPNGYTTEITGRFIRQLWPYSAMIEDKGEVRGSSYGFDDAKRALAYTKSVEIFEEIPITRDKNINAIFCPNGHIPGSASIIIREKISGKNILFTGDIGRPYQSINGGYNRFSSKYPYDIPIHVAVVESTCYAGQPIPFSKRLSFLQKEILDTFARGGNVLMPCIGDRYMEVVEMIHNSQKEGKLPQDIKFFRDGPSLDLVFSVYEGLGVEYFTTRYGDNPFYYKTTADSRSRFNLKNFKRIEKHAVSLANAERLAYHPEKAIVFASGGMGENGRVCNYLDSGFMNNPDNTYLASCYQVDGTVGSNLLKAYNQPGYKGARIVKLEGLSSHATGPEEIFGYLRRFNLEELEIIDLGHGSKFSIKSMENGIRLTEFGEYVDINSPKIGERIDLV